MKENKDIIGVCPICGETILENDKVFECSKKCGFRIFKEVLGAQITVDDLNQLIANSLTDVKTMMSKKGTEFKAQLRLKSNCKDLDFVFASNSKAGVDGKKIGTCPVCGKDVVAINGQYGKYYRCTACSFKMNGTIAKKSISETNAKLLLTKKATGVIKGFQSSKGKEFSARLVLDEDNKVIFNFDNEE